MEAHSRLAGARLALAVTIGTLIACSKDSGKPSAPPPVPPPELVSDSLATLDVNDFRISLDRNGLLRDGEWAGQCGVAFVAGLWVGALQEGIPRGNIVWDGSATWSNYTCRWDTLDIGVYLVTPAHLRNPDLEWPVAWGAPIDSSGAPALYGDAMAWASLRSDTLLSDPVMRDPIRGLAVSAACFGWDRADLRNVLFLRYDLSNQGALPMDSAFVGFYSDTDLAGAQNSTGFDLARGISYTYSPEASPGAPNYISGYALLDAPASEGTVHGVFSHRIMRKNAYLNPDFGETGFSSARQILWALEGLSNSGQSMFDPIAGGPTRYAFTGDPIAGTGWLDQVIDVRGMIASGPFTLRPGEARSMVVAWVVERGTTRAEALARLKTKIDAIRGEPDLWSPWRPPA